MDTKSGLEASQPTWWSVVQAIVWMVGRNEDLVQSAARINLLESIDDLRPRLTPKTFNDTPPISLAAAGPELLKAAQAKEITIRGRWGSEGELEPVIIHMNDRVQDHRDGVCIGRANVYLGGQYWSDLWIRSDDCRRQWPGPGNTSAARSVEVAATASSVAPSERVAAQTATFGRKKRTGVKPSKLQAVMAWIRQNHPAGIRADIKNEVVLADFHTATGMRVSEKTLRRALDELAAIPKENH